MTLGHNDKIFNKAISFSSNLANNFLLKSKSFSFLSQCRRAYSSARSKKIELDFYLKKNSSYSTISKKG